MSAADYAERREARIGHLHARAAKKQAEGEHQLMRDDALLGVMNATPILVGHHSEKRHRRALERVRAHTTAGFEALAEAKDLKRRAAAAERNDSISSDDPEALDRLRAKLAEQEAAHVLMAKGNLAIRASKGDDEQAATALLALGFDVAAARGALTYLGRKPYGFSLKNSSGGMRATKLRIQEIEQRATTAPPPAEQHGDITIVESDNRVRIIFPRKPDDATRAALKRAGFRWAPSEGAWQRHAGWQAWYAARDVVRRLLPAAVEPAEAAPHCDACGHERARCVCPGLCACGDERGSCDCRTDPNNGADDE